MRLPGTVVCLFGLAAGCVAQSEKTFERTLNVNGPVRLELNTYSGGIVVTPGPAGSVHVRGILKAQKGNWFAGNVEEKINRLVANPPIAQTGNNVRVGQVKEKDLLRGVSMRLEITAPAASEVKAKADSGGIKVDGINGPVDAQTDSGGIRVSRAAANVYARADSGGIEISDSGAAVDVATDSGGIRISQTKPAAIMARADSGGVTVRLAPGSGYEIRAEADSGRVSTPGMTVRGTMSNHRKEGKVGNGGPLVDIKVDSGGIDIR